MTTYYVSTTGNDSNPGTLSLPWRTIQKAANTAVAGDTVYVKQGTYNEQVTVENSGSTGKYITFASYPEKAATIDGAGVSMYVDTANGYGDGLFQIFGKSYINVVGFNIKNSVSVGIFVRKDYNTGTKSSYINIKNNYIYNTYSSGILMSGGSNYIIDGNEIELADNAPSTVTVQEVISVSTDVDTFEIKNNHVHNGGNPQFGGEGIVAKYIISNGKIYNNNVHDVVSVGIYVDSWTGSLDNVDIFQNRVYNVGIRGGDGIGVSSETGGTTSNVRIYNNLVYNNGLTGIEVPDYGYGTIKGVTITNNVFYNNGLYAEGGIEIGKWDSTVDNVIIRNNIVSENINWQIRVNNKPFVTNVVVDHNLIDSFKGYPDEIRGNNYVEANPMFVDPINANFHLQSNSPAIDKGSAIGAPLTDYDGNTRPYGTGYDIGAYEYIACTLNVVCNLVVT